MPKTPKPDKSKPDVPEADPPKVYDNSTAKVGTYKDLPKRPTYGQRGAEGTLVYSPDIAVFVETDLHGIIDLGPSITNFNLTRNVNQLSIFQCSFDNKWRKFDRTIRRMNRVAVFMKRIDWVQVFSGYITQAPWETITVGDAQMMAECTLKRLVHTYWDPQAPEAANLFPMFAVDGSWKQDDGGAAVSLYRMLTEVGGWPTDQIFIQKLPTSWMSQAFNLLKKTSDASVNENDAAKKDKDGNPIENEDAASERQRLIDALQQMFDNRGWNGQTDTALSPTDAAAAGLDYKDEAAFEADPNNKVGELPAEMLADIIWKNDGKGLGDNTIFAGSYTTNSGDSKGDVVPVQLRVDAATSMNALLAAIPSKIRGKQTVVSAKLNGETETSFYSDVLTSGYLSKDDGGDDSSGWGITITIGSGPMATWLNDNPAQMEKFGWKGNTFEGTGPPTSTPEADSYTFLAGVGDNPAAGEAAATADMSATNTLYYWPGFSIESVAFTGDRAWINDVPLMQSIQTLASAAMRDFMSGPDGSFVAFFPNRIGTGKQATSMQVRNIEVRDFKSVISDSNLVTHYVSVGDFAPPSEDQLPGKDLINVLVNGGVVTIEQEALMAHLLGLEEGEAKGLSKFMMNRFGLRPMKQENYAARNAGWNFAIALHRFQEMWANQWIVQVTFTYMPEVFPGMRIELIDNDPPLAVYVEAVNHTGSRTGGFLSNITISTPTRWSVEKQKWVMLPSEFVPSTTGAAKLLEDVVNGVTDGIANNLTAIVDNQK